MLGTAPSPPPRPPSSGGKTGEKWRRNHNVVNKHFMFATLCFKFRTEPTAKPGWTEPVPSLIWLACSEHAPASCTGLSLLLPHPMQGRVRGSSGTGQVLMKREFWDRTIRTRNVCRLEVSSLLAISWNIDAIMWHTLSPVFLSLCFRASILASCSLTVYCSWPSLSRSSSTCFSNSCTVWCWIPLVNKPVCYRKPVQRPFCIVHSSTREMAKFTMTISV